jgi:hypothetical protein
MAVMSRARMLSLAIAAVGLAVGTMFDAPRVTAPVRAGAYYVLAADFHVHAFPGDGALPRWELAREASRRGLHAIVVSNHNQTVAPKFMSGMFSDRGVLVIPSQEVTTPNFHLVAAGVTHTIDWRKPELEIVRDIHAQGGVVIAAHPVNRFWKGSDALLALIDGAEVAHPLTTMVETGRGELNAMFARGRRVNPDLAPIGSSDFHMVAPLGVCRTYAFAESVSVAGVLDAIRAGRTVAQDQDGVLYGDPGLTLLLDQTDATVPAPRPRRLAMLAALMVLAGLLAAALRR